MDDFPFLFSPEQEEEDQEALLCPVKTPTELVGVGAAWQPVHAKPSALQRCACVLYVFAPMPSV